MLTSSGAGRAVERTPGATAGKGLRVRKTGTTAEGGTGTRGAGRRLLVTAGPTHEPIDSVRYIANRSSGRLGVAIASAAAARGWDVTLLLGPAPIEVGDPRVRVERFRSTAELQGLLEKRFPECDVLVQAAAVADFRPVGGDPGDGQVKMRRGDGPIALRLEPTPDLLGWCAEHRRPGQVLIGFALEPADRLMASAREKLDRKRVDAVVANPLETMDSPDVEATVVFRDGHEERTGGATPKEDFAVWLLERVEAIRVPER